MKGLLGVEVFREVQVGNVRARLGGLASQYTCGHPNKCTAPIHGQKCVNSNDITSNRFLIATAAIAMAFEK